MLSRARIVDIVNAKLPEPELKQALLELTPDRIDEQTLETFLVAMSETLAEGSDSIQRLGADAVDCTGTGGSGLPHYNTSTTVSFVLAAAGLKVLKCSNAGASSRSGSFDFLSALGFPRHLPVSSVAELFELNNLTFLFAPQFYPLLARLAPVRRELGVKTIFNFIGPLLNPGSPSYRVLGVSDRRMQRLIADHICRTNASTRTLVVRGEDGADEFTVNGATRVYEIVDRKLSETSHTMICPMKPGQLDVKDNVRIFHDLIGGHDSQSCYYHMVCLNAGAAFKLTGRTETIESGAQLCGKLLASGSVREKYEQARRSYARYIA
jgi:anthranilate phosphoribosyltransferase